MDNHVCANAMPVKRGGGFRLLAMLCLCLALHPACRGADEYPETLPPPPELLEAVDSVTPIEETERALEPPPVVEAPSAEPTTIQAEAPTPAVSPVYVLPEDSSGNGRIVYTAPDPADPALQLAQPSFRAPAVIPAGSGIVISGPSPNMPADYFELPLTTDSIPGILLPELEDGYYPDNEYYAAPPARLQAPIIGMTVRQLEPFFALAKGTEGEALNARRRNDDAVYHDMLNKARAAYMEIVSMADAGNEAREEAWYGVARCEYRLGNWWRSFEALERSFPEEYQPGEVAARMKLETFVGERLWRLGNAPVPDARYDNQSLNGYQAAARVYSALIANQPSHDDAPLALLRQGDAASLRGDWERASRFYRQVVEYYADSEQAMQARSSLAEAIYRQEWPTGMPEAARRDAQVVMEDVERSDVLLSPDAADRRRRAVEVANNTDAEIKLRHAKEYLGSMRMRKSRDGAIFLLKDIINLYPGTSQATEAGEMLVAMGIEPPRPAGNVAYSPFSQPSPWGDQQENPNLYDNFAGLDETDSYVTLDVPADIPSFTNLPGSPTRETVYQALPPPTVQPLP